jgi:broad specificity phosphatase PhoE
MMSTIDHNVSVIVVARHGERLDYYIRDNPNVSNNVTNWVANAERPFDPPLTDHGKEQAKKLGQHLSNELLQLGFPSISEIYTSPLLRCRQTSFAARSGLGNDEGTIPVRVEEALVESINEHWYRSWALPGADGTWGYCIDDKDSYDVETIHPLAKQPVQTLLDEWISDDQIDKSYTSKTSIMEPYCFHPPHLESSAEQRKRMKGVVSSVHKPGTTVMLVSHGGPVTHLFEELVGESWHIHGEATYCSYSIYKKTKSETGDDTWESVQINQSKHLKEMLVGHQYITDDDP